VWQCTDGQSRLGLENTVAMDFDIGEQTHAALFGKIMAVA
jgi:hypothetical protein